MTRFLRVRPLRSSRSFRALVCAAAGFAPVLLWAEPAQYPIQTSPPPRLPTSQAPELPGSQAFDDWSDEIPAHVFVVDGAATLERDGTTEPAEAGTPLLAGDRLQTDRGRVSILFADGSALDLDQYSSVDLLSDSLARLNEGQVRFALARAAASVAYRIDTAGTTTMIRSAGEYRVSVSDRRVEFPQVTLVVLRGSAELSTASGRTLVRTGMAAATTARTEPSLPYAVTTASWDPFERWANDQYDARMSENSSRYLPSEVRAYGASFDRDGAWQYDATYGTVWYPRVNVGWRPYSDGRWSFVGRFGWVWIGLDRWSWPTHHYGRWGVNADRWYWIPDRRWSPAWVSWASAPGYTSWCPLGFDGRPVYAVSTFAYGRNDAWRGWTVLSTQSFSRGVRAIDVRRDAIGNRGLAPSVAGQFAERRGGPSRPTTARVDVAPLRAPGGMTPRIQGPSSREISPRTGNGMSREASGPSREVAPRRDVGSPRQGPTIRQDPAPATDPWSNVNRMNGWSRTPSPPSTPSRPDSTAPTTPSRRLDATPRSAPTQAPSTPSSSWRNEGGVTRRVDPRAEAPGTQPRDDRGARTARPEATAPAPQRFSGMSRSGSTQAREPRESTPPPSSAGARPRGGEPRTSPAPPPNSGGSRASAPARRSGGDSGSSGQARARNGRGGE